jgi:hypothetical protein
MGSPSLRELVASCLIFPRDQSRLKWSSITLDIVTTPSRGLTVTVQYQDGNSWTVTI